MFAQANINTSINQSERVHHLNIFLLTLSHNQGCAVKAPDWRLTFDFERPKKTTKSKAGCPARQSWALVLIGKLMYLKFFS